MKFEVRGRKGKVLFSTRHKHCIPPAKIRNQMRKVDLKLFQDGKPFKGVE